MGNIFPLRLMVRSSAAVGAGSQCFWARSLFSGNRLSPCAAVTKVLFQAAVPSSQWGHGVFSVVSRARASFSGVGSARLILQRYKRKGDRR